MNVEPRSDRELAEERTHIGRMAMLQVGALLLAILEDEGSIPGLIAALPGYLGTMRKRLAISGIEVVVVQEAHRVVEDQTSDVTVHIRGGADYIHLTSVVGQSYLAGHLRSDGVIDNESFGTLMPTSSRRDRALMTTDEASLSRDLKTNAFTQVGSFGAEDFLRTIVTRPSLGKAVQLLGVELYGSGVIVNYQVHPAQLAGVDATVDIELSDDSGTRYRLASHHKSGIEFFHCAAEFTPTVPPSARNLKVIAGPADWTLYLDNAPEGWAKIRAK